MSNDTSVIHYGLSVQQKAVHLAVHFLQGKEYTTEQVATMYDITHMGAYKLLNNISYALPLVTTDERPCRWKRFDFE